MKKFLLLSVLILFSCSKDSEEAVAPGDEIIGTHQIIYFISGTGPANNLPSGLQLSRLMTVPIFEGSSITFNANKKGSFNLNMSGYESYQAYDFRNVNFDWSFDGARWNILLEKPFPNGRDLYITKFDYYTLTDGGDTKLYFD